jgi:pescadillo
MPRGFHKKQKSFISKELTIKNLGLQPKEFERLVVLCGVHPYVPRDRNKVDKGFDFYYRVSDVDGLQHSEVYRVILKQREYNEKVERARGTGVEYRIPYMKRHEVCYVDLVRKRYRSLGASLDDLGNTLNDLYLARMLGFKDLEVLDGLEQLIAENSLLDLSFMSTGGIFNQAHFGKIKVTWFVPYPGAGLGGMVEEKKDVSPDLRWEALSFLDFVSSDEEAESEPEEMVPLVNDPNKLDVSILSYSVPLLMVHCKLVLHKLGKLYAGHVSGRTMIFSGLKFLVKRERIENHLRIIIRSCGGEVTGSVQEADVYVSEEVEELAEEIVYVQPQYLFDCLNAGKKLDTGPYLVGRELPEHRSPFPSISNIVTREHLMTMSRRKREMVDSIINQFEDVQEADY